jgi:predicted HAD superfamily Cof-like phosphohydrolase
MSQLKFDEPQALTDVAKFHDTFNLPIIAEPSIPSVERIKLRLSLLQEELNELEEALNNKDIIETADALADLQYVLSGAILEFGLGGKFKKVFDEVQRSNMSKVCATLDEAEATQKHYQDTKGTESYIQKKGEEYLVYRKEDGKVLKSIKYSPANIGQSLL